MLIYQELFYMVGTEQGILLRVNFKKHILDLSLSISMPNIKFSVNRMFHVSKIIVFRLDLYARLPDSVNQDLEFVYKP